MTRFDDAWQIMREDVYIRYEGVYIRHKDVYIRDEDVYIRYRLNAKSKCIHKLIQKPFLLTTGTRTIS